jgi:hypothetical protein
MAPKNSTKAAVLEETEEVEVELTAKQVINEGIARVIDATGIDVQKNRYKAMRAIAFEAFAQAIEAGTFDDLVDAAIANIDELPAGWEVERPVKEEVKKAPTKSAKATPAKSASKAAPTKGAAAKPAAKTGARRRPTR